MTVVYTPRPRYVVETANTIESQTGERAPGLWNFGFAFHARNDAITAADRLAEDNEYVRVIDRAETNEENA